MSVVIDPILIAIGFFILGAVAGRADLRATRKAHTIKPGGLYLVWSNGRRKS